MRLFETIHTRLLDKEQIVYPCIYFSPELVRSISKSQLQRLHVSDFHEHNTIDYNPQCSVGWSASFLTASLARHCTCGALLRGLSVLCTNVHVRNTSRHVRCVTARPPGALTRMCRI